MIGVGSEIKALSAFEMSRSLCMRDSGTVLISSAPNPSEARDERINPVKEEARESLAPRHLASFSTIPDFVTGNPTLGADLDLFGGYWRLSLMICLSVLFIADFGMDWFDDSEEDAEKILRFTHDGDPKNTIATEAGLRLMPQASEYQTPNSKCQKPELERGYNPTLQQDVTSAGALHSTITTGNIKTETMPDEVEPQCKLPLTRGSDKILAEAERFFAQAGGRGIEIHARNTQANSEEPSTFNSDCNTPEGLRRRS